MHSMARFAPYTRIASLVVATLLFLMPFYRLLNGIPAASLGFLPDHAALSAIAVLGLGAASWRSAVVAGIVFGMLANAIYACFDFGWFQAVYGEALNSPDKGWGDAAIDILAWTPFISVMAATLGYLVRWVLLQTVGRLVAR